jgi:hypothetical protein
MSDNSVAIYTIVWGEKFRAHLPEWFAAIDALEVKPDQIIVATLPDEVSFLEAYPCEVVVCEYPTVERMSNAAVAKARTTWISGCAMDDRYRPEAFNDLPDMADDVGVVSVGVITTNGERVDARPGQNMLDGNPHGVLGTSYIRRSLWEQLGGYDERYIISDWALWIKAMKVGAKFWMSPRFTHVIDIDSPGRFSSNGFGAEAYKQLDDLRSDRVPTVDLEVR